MRMMVEFKLDGSAREPRYVPIGVWAQDGDELDILYMPKHPQLQAKAEALMADLDGKRLPDDLLEFWSTRLPGHLGMMGEIVDADGYDTVDRKSVV